MICALGGSLGGRRYACFWRIHEISLFSKIVQKRVSRSTHVFLWSFKNVFLDLRSFKMSGQHRVQDWSKIVSVDLGGLNAKPRPSGAEPMRAELIRLSCLRVLGSSNSGQCFGRGGAFRSGSNGGVHLHLGTLGVQEIVLQ